MIIGTDVVNGGGKTIFGFSASYSGYLTQYFSKILTHDLPKRESNKGVRASKDEKETDVTEKRTEIMIQLVKEALQRYNKLNQGALPEQVVIYRDGIGGPTLQQKCLEYEVPRIIETLSTFTNNYKPRILYVFVDRNINHRLFYKSNGDVLNPGPGTVVDASLVEC